MSEWEHCHRELAGGGGEGEGVADIKSKNPHLTGREDQVQNTGCTWKSAAFPAFPG